MITPQQIYRSYRLIHNRLYRLNGKPVTADHIQFDGVRYKYEHVLGILRKWLDNNRPTPVNLTTEYITKAGHPVKLFAIIGEHEPVKGIIEYESNKWAACEWDICGTHPNNDYSLVPYESTISETE